MFLKVCICHRKLVICQKCTEPPLAAAVWCVIIGITILFASQITNGVSGALIVTPLNTVVVIREKLILQCVSNLSDIKINWNFWSTHSGRRAKPENRFLDVLDSNWVNDVASFNDSGTYECVDENGSDSAVKDGNNATAQLVVLDDHLQCFHNISNISVMNNVRALNITPDLINITCSLDYRGSEAPVLRFHQNGRHPPPHGIVTNHTETNVQFNSRVSYTFLFQLNKMLNGSWITCETEHAYYSATGNKPSWTSPLFNALVFDKMTPTSHASPPPINKLCSTYTNIECIYKWTNAEKRLTFNTQILSINQTDEALSGLYICTADCRFRGKTFPVQNVQSVEVLITASSKDRRIIDNVIWIGIMGGGAGVLLIAVIIICFLKPRACFSKRQWPSSHQSLAPMYSQVRAEEENKERMKTEETSSQNGSKNLASGQQFKLKEDDEISFIDLNQRRDVTELNQDDSGIGEQSESPKDKQLYQAIQQDSPDANPNYFKNKLLKHKEVLVPRLDCNHGLLEDLMQANVLSSSDVCEIKKCDVSSMQASKLLELVSQEMNESVYEAFLSALKLSEQCHLAMFIRQNGVIQPSNENPLSEKEFDKLRDHHTFLLNNLDPMKLLQHQFAYECMNPVLVEEIKGYDDDWRMNLEILKALRHGNLLQYEAFVKCLHLTGQANVANRLEGRKTHRWTSASSGIDDVTPISTNFKKKVTKHIDVLMEKMDCQYGLLDCLYSKNVLSFDELEMVRSIGDLQDQKARVIALVSYEMDETKFEEFLLALKDSDQSHLALYIRNDGIVQDTNEVTLNTTQSVTLRDNHEFLLQYINSERLLQSDFIHECLNPMQIDEIRQLPSNDARNDAILKHLQKGCSAQYVRFMQLLLHTDHKFVADKLRESEDSHQTVVRIGQGEQPDDVTLV